MSILNQITVILISSVFFGAILKYLKQPIFLAHIIVGLFVGTILFKDIDLSSGNQIFEIVVSLLLFISGLSLDLRNLKDLGENIFIKNIFAFLVIFVLFFFGVNFLGFDSLESVIISLGLAFSSSVTFNKLVVDENLQRNLFTKIVSNHLLIQSLFLTLVLVFLNSFSMSIGSENINELFLNNLVKTIILIVNLYLVSRYIINRFDGFVASSNEFMFLFVIGFGFGVVSLFKFLNLSYELGALVGGILLSMHHFTYEITYKLKVIREICLLAFYVFLGASLNFNVLSEKFLLIIILIIFIITTKNLINLSIEKLFKTNLRENFFSSLSLTSISEFSLVIILLAASNGMISKEFFSIFGFIYIFLSFLNIYLIKHRKFIYDKYFESLQIFKSKEQLSEKIKDIDVILIGCGKLGFDFLESYKYLKSKLLVVDFDFAILKKLDKLKVNSTYGDISDMEFFESIPYLNSKLIYFSLSNSELIKEILLRLKQKKYSGVKIVVSYKYSDTLEFYRLGADYVVMPEFISGKFVSDLTLNLGFDCKKYLPEKSISLDSIKLKESHNF